MKLYLYELYKIFCKKIVWLCVLGLFVANGALFVVQQRSEDENFFVNKDAYIAFEAQYIDADYTTLAEEMSRLEEELNALAERVRYIEGIREDSSISEFYATYLEDWYKEYPDLEEKYAGTIYLEDRWACYDAVHLVSRLVPQLEHITGYPDFIAGMEERAKQMSTVSIFQKKGSFSNNNILRTPKDFAPLASLPLTLGYEDGVVAATDFRLTDLFLPALLFLFCVYLFLHERETGLDRLVNATRRGRFPMIAAKLGVLCTLAVLLSLLFYASILVIGGELYGYGDLSRYIQSLPAFRDCTLPITVGEYLGLYLATKVGAALLTAALLAVCFIVFGSGRSVFVMLAVFAGVSYVCYAFIHSASWANLAKYVNIFSAYDVYNLFRLYININFVSIPLNRVTLCTWAGVIAFVAATGMACYGYVSHLRLDFIDRLLTTAGNRLLRRWRSRPLRGTLSLFAHENRRLYATGRAWMFVLVALFLAYNAWDVEPLRLGSPEDAAYKVYANYWSGELTPEKIDEIEAEGAYLKSIPKLLDDLTVQYRQGKLTEDEYYARYDELYAYSEKREVGFETFYAQYTQSMALRKSVTPAIVDTISSDFLFDSESRDLLRGLEYVLLLILALSRVFPLDTERGLTPILRCTRNGRAKMLSHRLAASALCALLLWLCLYTPTFVTLFAKYRLSFTSHIQNVEQFRSLPVPVSVWAFIALMMLLQLTATMTAAVWTLNLTRWVKKLSFGVMLTAVVLAAPFLMLLLGFDFMRPFSLVAAFTPYQAAELYGAGMVWYALGLGAVLSGGLVCLYRDRR